MKPICGKEKQIPIHDINGSAIRLEFPVTKTFKEHMSKGVNPRLLSCYFSVRQQKPWWRVVFGYLVEFVSAINIETTVSHMNPVRVFLS